VINVCLHKKIVLFHLCLTFSVFEASMTVYGTSIQLHVFMKQV